MLPLAQDLECWTAEESRSVLPLAQDLEYWSAEALPSVLGLALDSAYWSAELSPSVLRSAQGSACWSDELSPSVLRSAPKWAQPPSLQEPAYQLEPGPSLASRSVPVGRCRSAVVPPSAPDLPCR